jgi:ABC-2 type transport system permease protein
MTQLAHQSSIQRPGASADIHLGLGSRLSALAALFVLSLRHHVRGKRLLILAVLFLLPVGIALLGHRFDNNAQQFEYILLLNMIPHAMAPLAALLYASGIIQDEVEDQTLTYLLIRSLSKRSIYLVKLLATFLTAILLTAVFATITCLVIYWKAPDLWTTIVPHRVPKIVALMSLSLVAYCSLFGCLSLFVRRSLVVGIGYIIVLEGMLGSFDFAARRLTVVYYFRVLVARWLGIQEGFAREWSLHLDTDPTAQQCVLILLVGSLVASILAMQVFATREFHVKTPEQA